MKRSLKKTAGFWGGAIVESVQLYPLSEALGRAVLNHGHIYLHFSL